MANATGVARFMESDENRFSPQVALRSFVFMQPRRHNPAHGAKEMLTKAKTDLRRGASTISDDWEVAILRVMEISGRFSRIQHVHDHLVGTPWAS